MWLTSSLQMPLRFLVSVCNAGYWHMSLQRQDKQDNWHTHPICIYKGSSFCQKTICNYLHNNYNSKWVVTHMWKYTCKSQGTIYTSFCWKSPAIKEMYYRFKHLKTSLCYHTELYTSCLVWKEQFEKRYLKRENLKWDILENQEKEQNGA